MRNLTRNIKRYRVDRSRQTRIGTRELENSLRELQTTEQNLADRNENANLSAIDVAEIRQRIATAEPQQQNLAQQILEGEHQQNGGVEDLGQLNQNLTSSLNRYNEADEDVNQILQDETALRTDIAGQLRNQANAVRFVGNNAARNLENAAQSQDETTSREYRESAETLRGVSTNAARSFELTADTIELSLQTKQRHQEDISRMRQQLTGMQLISAVLPPPPQPPRQPGGWGSKLLSGISVIGLVGVSVLLSVMFVPDNYRDRLRGRKRQQDNVKPPTQLKKPLPKSTPYNIRKIEDADEESPNSD